jgi:hypothetical protein
MYQNEWSCSSSQVDQVEILCYLMLYELLHQTINKYIMSGFGLIMGYLFTTYYVSQQISFK